MTNEEVILRAAGKWMGRKGGAVQSDKKRESCRKNAKKAGRKRSYSYQMKGQAIMGKKYEITCLIPDEVVEDPEKYRTKTFGVYIGTKRLNARVWEVDKNKKNIRVRRV